MNNIPLCLYTVFSLSIHLSMDTGFNISAIVNNTAMSMDVHVCLCDPAFNTLGNITSSDIAGPYNKCMRNFEGKGQGVFHIYCTISLSNRLCTRVLISPHTHPKLLFSVCGGHFLGNSSHPHGCEVT